MSRVGHRLEALVKQGKLQDEISAGVWQGEIKGALTVNNVQVVIGGNVGKKGVSTVDLFKRAPSSQNLAGIGDGGKV